VVSTVDAFQRILDPPPPRSAAAPCLSPSASLLKYALRLLSLYAPSNITILFRSLQLLVTFALRLLKSRLCSQTPPPELLTSPLALNPTTTCCHQPRTQRHPTAQMAAQQQNTKTHNTAAQQDGQSEGSNHVAEEDNENEYTYALTSSSA
jgi:hypothetical protein